MTLDLIDLSRLEQGKMPLTLEICDLTELAARVRDTLGSLDRERPITLEHSGPVVAQCDPVIIRRVIENLVSNCVKHTPAGSAVRIVLTEGIDRVRIAVHDQGPGIAPDARARIFEKFGTLETRQQQRYHSSGLGLAFCKLAVEAHRGTIGVDAGVSSGSTFWFELPTAAE
jgi:signal transduction histidine kinase